MSDAAKTQVLEVSTEQMARMMDQAKKRAKLQFISDLEVRAATLDKTEPAAANVLRAYCEELRETIIPTVTKRTPVVTQVPAATSSGGEVDPLDTVDERVAAQEATGSVLPEVQHRSDEADATAMVRNLGARGKLNFLRD